jgi:hypothetical protein
MWRYRDNTFKQKLPRCIDLDGFSYATADLTREQWDTAGYNEAIPVKREPFTSYETKWVKGDDLIYREEAVSATLDEETRDKALSDTIRVERTKLLTGSDWTQSVDSPLSSETVTAWASYRQALRDITGQEGFPGTVQWPMPPDETVLDGPEEI